MTKTRTAITCPDCGGSIERIEDGGLVQYKCRVGHLYSPQSALAVHSDREENMLWSAVVILREGADLAEEIAGLESGEEAELLRSQAEAKRALADQVEQVVREFPKVSIMRID